MTRPKDFSRIDLEDLACEFLWPMSFLWREDFGLLQASILLWRRAESLVAFLEDLERAWKESRALCDEARYHRERVRLGLIGFEALPLLGLLEAGLLGEDKLRILACLGFDPAVELRGLALVEHAARLDLAGAIDVFYEDQAPLGAEWWSFLAACTCPVVFASCALIVLKGDCLRYRADLGPEPASYQDSDEWARFLTAPEYQQFIAWFENEVFGPGEPAAPPPKLVGSWYGPCVSRVELVESLNRFWQGQALWPEDISEIYKNLEGFSVPGDREMLHRVLVPRILAESGGPPSVLDEG